MFRESAETAESADTVEQIENRVLESALAGMEDMTGMTNTFGVAMADADDSDADLSRHLLHAVEAYKASCAAAGEQPTQEDAWLVLLSALQLEDAK